MTISTAELTKSISVLHGNLAYLLAVPQLIVKDRDTFAATASPADLAAYDAQIALDIAQFNTVLNSLAAAIGTATVNWTNRPKPPNLL